MAEATTRKISERVPSSESHRRCFKRGDSRNAKGKTEQPDAANKLTSDHHQHGVYRAFPNNGARKHFRHRNRKADRRLGGEDESSVQRPLEPKTVKVVPRLVEQSAAPAAKHWMDVAWMRSRRMKDSPMGKPISAVATPIERYIFALSELSDVDKPPLAIYQEEKAKVAKLDNGMLSLYTKPFPPGVSQATPKKTCPSRPQYTALSRMVLTTLRSKRKLDDENRHHPRLVVRRRGRCSGDLLHGGV
nr:hypothetical protein L203_01419 [Cryptococcus depauperatus CBS 7841]